MKSDIEITAILSKTESVRRGNISANVRTDSGTVTSIENGAVTDPDNGNTLATFSQWQGSGLNVQFQTPEADYIGILTDINTFINDVKE